MKIAGQPVILRSPAPSYPCIVGCRTFHSILHMRFRALIVSSLLVFSAPALSQERVGAPVPVTPWMDEELDIADLRISPLSLADLEGKESGTIQNEKTALSSPKSTLEKAYAARIVDELPQFGYDLFSSASATQTQEKFQPTGIVDDAYILSAGDMLDIILRGQVSARHAVTVDQKGRLILEDFPPIPAAARTLGDVRADLEAEAAQIPNTNIFVTLSGIRQVGVLVVGDVVSPGRQTLSSFHTVLDALNAAGGIEKTGSLRKVKLIRGGKTTTIDLYHLLLRDGGRADMTLRDGDRIIVPPIGPTVGLGGFVKRPGIYEILDQERLSLKQILGLGGGLITPGKIRFIHLHLSQDGRENAQDVEDMSMPLFSDGSILMATTAQAAAEGSITLSGHTREPGTHALNRAQTLSALIGNAAVLGPDIYPLIGIIARTDPASLAKKLLPFSPHQVMTGLQDQTLQNGDTVYLFSNADIRALDPDNAPPLLHKASTAVNLNQTSAITDPLLRSFLQERSAFIRGAVRVPGAYPVSDGARLDALLAAAGGTTLEAATDNIEWTRREGGGASRTTLDLANAAVMETLITPGDTVRVNQSFHRIADKSVTLHGEVARPGRYDLSPGDTLSALIARAGGLTPHAYPDGAIFSRAGERKTEEQRYRAQARDLELKLASTLQSAQKDKKPDPAEIAAVQDLITELKDAKAVGRITVETDPAILADDPEQDILLESGDRIFIPARPLTVRVAGEVLSPAALQFRKDRSPQDYIRQAGGTTYYADKGRSFVIYPDGSAQPLEIGLWDHAAVMVPPGSTIVVPRDPEPFSFIEGAERVSQILANLAISGLYVEAIGDDD